MENEFLVFEQYNEIEKLKNGKMEYIIKVFGEKNSFWYGVEVPFLVQLTNGYENNLFEHLKVKCLLPFLHHPAVSLDGQCSLRTNGFSSFCNMFGISYKPFKKSSPKSISFLESLSLLFSFLPSITKFAGLSRWDPIQFSSQRASITTLWNPERHSYFDKQSKIIIFLMINVYYFLRKKRFSQKQFKPENLQLISNLPKNLYYYYLGFVGKNSLIVYSRKNETSYD